MAVQEQAIAQLRMELNVAQSRLSKVEGHEWAVTSTYEDLKKDLDHFRSSHVAVMKEKADLEKIECEKVQRFRNSLHKKPT